ncbi:hypothetical protein DIPPA_26633 [Diplonema papillatum]|nr:hypothetical protein DIPPA_26633 [Diplonema papillatum]
MTEPTPAPLLHHTPFPFFNKPGLPSEKQMLAQAGLAGYVLAFAKRLWSERQQTKEQKAAERTKTALSDTYFTAAAGAVVVLLGTRVFMWVPDVPLFLPTLGMTTALIAYLQLSYDQLGRAGNNAHFRRSLALLAPCAFFGGWTVGPFAWAFRKFLFRVYAPACVSCFLAFGVAARVADRPMSLFVHAPLASACLAAGGTYPLLLESTRFMKQSAYRGFLVCTAVFTAAAGGHAAMFAGARHPVDVATHALGLVACGTISFYLVMRRVVRSTVQKAMKAALGDPGDEHDARALSSTASALLLLLYYRTVAKVRSGKY